MGRRATTVVALTLAALFLWPALTGAQQAVFRAGTRLIVQAVTVTDRDGRPLEGLTADDFVLTEDDVPQAISLVDFQRIEPARRASSGGAVDGAPAGPDITATAGAGVISSGGAGQVRYRDRRLLVLYFDLTALPGGDLVRAYTAAKQYIEQDMSAIDLVALMSFEGGSVKVRTDFTDDRARLGEALQRLIFGDDLDGDGVPDAGTDTGTAFGQDDAEFNILNTDRQLSALQTAVSMLGALPERKSLVYFSTALRLNGVDNQAQLRATTNAAIKADVAIYPVDARGLVASAPLGDATRQVSAGAAAFNGQLAARTQASQQRSQDTLYSLAADTGGRALFDVNDLAQGIRQAADAVKSYYILGYYTTHTARDGRFHRVKVRLRSGAEARLDYRQGYFADKEFGRSTNADKERQLEEALMLENPLTDVAIAMEVNYFQLNRAEYFVPVAVKIPGSELALARRGGAQRTVIDFIGEVKDDYGVTIQNVRDRLDIPLSDRTAAQLASRPVQYDTGFTLLPGRYVLKILARDSVTGRIGTFQGAFTIPNLNREERSLPISSVVLGSQTVPLSDALFTVRTSAALAVHPLVADGQKLLPSVTRVFSRGRDLQVYLQAYERDTEQMRPVVAYATLYRDGVKAFESAPVGVDEGMDARSKAVPVRFSVSLADLPPGRYDCQITVLDPGGQKSNYWRAPIVIVP